MPVFEYMCTSCEERFEKLMFRVSASVSCPECGSEQVERLPSTFGMSGVEKQTGSAAACSSCSAGSCSSCSQ